MFPEEYWLIFVLNQSYSRKLGTRDKASTINRVLDVKQTCPYYMIFAWKFYEGPHF